MKNYDLALLILRLALGIIFIAHGMQKLFGTFGGSGVDGFSKMLMSQGFPFPEVLAWLVALTEFLGGIGLVFGIVPRICAFGIGIVIAVAIWKVHFQSGLFSSSGGYEYQLLILASCLVILLCGAGKFSFFDRF
ncbi:MAG: DoxX family protein [Candidatus Omnitrophota bacterium]